MPVTVSNYGEEPVEGEVRLTAPDGFAVTPPSAAVAC